jgi:sugar O-acyltransferase (sialic acid O-acetyltransferase NeuD family)
MPKPILFWGASGHAKVLHEFIGQTGYELAALVDNCAGIPSPIRGVPVLHGKEGLREWLGNWAGGKLHGLIAIGGDRGRDRAELQCYLETLGISPVLAIHPKAFVAGSASLGSGTQCLAMSAICAESVLGPACIVNTHASVDHECRLGTGVHVGPGATVAGCVTIGDYSFIGSGAVILPRVCIGAGTIIGAGAVVSKNVPDNVVAVGNPARIKRNIF